MWQPLDRLKAIRMLGRQPLDAVDDRRVRAIYLHCWAMDPEEPEGFTDLYNELTLKERNAYLDRLNAREPMANLPARPEAARADLLALIAAEEERLEAVLAGHLEREEAEAAAELAFDDSAWGERLRRYEVSNDKTLLRIIETLRKRQREADGAGSPAARVSVPAGSPSGDLRSSPEAGSEDPRPTDPGEQACTQAGFPPPETEEDDVQEVDGLREEAIRARVARIARALSLSAEYPATGASNEATSEEPGPRPAPTEARSPGDAACGSADLTDVAINDAKAPPSIDEGLRTPTNVTTPPDASARLLAGAVLALFALLVLAGFSAASDRVREARTESPVGCFAPRISRILYCAGDDAAAEDAGGWVQGAATVRSGLRDRLDR